MPLKVVQDYLGHADSKSTEIYIHIMHEDKVMAVQKISGILDIPVAKNADSYAEISNTCADVGVNMGADISNLPEFVSNFDNY